MEKIEVYEVRHTVDSKSRKRVPVRGELLFKGEIQEGLSVSEVSTMLSNGLAQLAPASKKASGGGGSAA